IVAIAKGEENAKWLAAATEDRFLMNIGRPQRFATQYRSDGPNAEFKLYTVGPGVTDELRRALNVPTLARLRRGRPPSIKSQSLRNEFSIALTSRAGPVMPTVTSNMPLFG